MRRREGRAAARMFRRVLAVALAAVALWMLTLAAGNLNVTQATGDLTADGDFLTTLLRTELGASAPQPNALGQLTPLQRLAVGQSPLMRTLWDKTEDGHWPAGDTPGGSEATPPPDGGDEAPLPATTTAPDSIIPRTLIPSAGVDYAVADGVYIYNRTSQTFDVNALNAAPVNFTLSNDGPQVLIIHTHTCEAYTQDGTDVYAESDASRTMNPEYNVIRVGEEIKKEFEALGLNVLHDQTIYDYPEYNGAYTRSKAGAEEYLKKYPSIKVVLDIHRDALVADDGTVFKAVTAIDGTPTAQVMLVMGTDERGGDYGQWRENLTLAMKVQKRMNTLYPTLARPITLRTSHYNQQLAPGAMLVEVGTHGNTLQESLAGARLFARACGQVLVEQKAP